jgi:general secretion pathway protein I
MKPFCRVSKRRGLSLLEVMLSIAILGSSLVVIGQLIGNGYRSAAQARLRTAATIHCDAVMAEVAAGSISVSSGASGNVTGTDEWSYNVASMPGVQPGLLSVTVTVTQTGGVANPLSLSVVRFMPDPDYEPEDPLQ